MSTVASPLEQTNTAAAPARPGAAAVAYVVRNPMLVISSIVILLLVFVAVFADYIAPYDPTAIHMGGIIVNGKRIQPPYPPAPNFGLAPTNWAVTFSAACCMAFALRSLSAWSCAVA